MERPIHRADPGSESGGLKFRKLSIPGVFVVEADRRSDARGFFERVFCGQAFKKMKLRHQVCQTNISYNEKKGTLRGLHYQKAPHAEAKLISCPKGKLYDVVLDLRRRSKTYGQWEAVELSGSKPQFLYIPEGCAHGFQTLEKHTLVFYHMFSFFHPDAAAGIRFDDPRFKIRWPLPVKILSEKDKSYHDSKG